MRTVTGPWGTMTRGTPYPALDGMDDRIALTIHLAAVAGNRFAAAVNPEACVCVIYVRAPGGAQTAAHDH